MGRSGGWGREGELPLGIEKEILFLINGTREWGSAVEVNSFFSQYTVSPVPTSTPN